MVRIGLACSKNSKDAPRKLYKDEDQGTERREVRAANINDLREWKHSLIMELMCSKSHDVG